MRPVEAMLVPMTDAVTAVIFDAPASARYGKAERLRLLVDEAPLSGPSVSTRLRLRSGGERWVMLVAARTAALAPRRVRLLLGDTPVAAIEPEWLQDPVVEPAELIDGLSEEGRIRLLKLFLTTGASLFGADAARDFVSAAGRLLEYMGVHAMQPVSWCRLGGAARLVTYRVHEGFDPARVGDFVVLSGGRPKRLVGYDLRYEAGEQGGLLHMVLPMPLTPETGLVSTGARPLFLRMPTGAAHVLTPGSSSAAGMSAAGCMVSSRRPRDRTRSPPRWPKRSVGSNPRRLRSPWLTFHQLRPAYSIGSGSRTRVISCGRW